MTKWTPLWRLFLFSALIFSGCDRMARGPLDEEKDPHYIAGQNKATAYDWDGAIESFEKALQSNPSNAAAHLALGSLYYDRKGDYAAAVYHFERHLKLRPQSPMAEVVNGHIVACKRELAKTVSYALVTPDVQQQIDRYAKTNDLLRRQIQMMQLELNRRPQYITNYVTNFVGIPNFSPTERSAARMTRPAEPIPETPEPAAPAPEPEPVQQPAPRPVTAQRPQQTEPRSDSRSAPRQTATANPSSTQRPSRTHIVRPGETLAVVASKYGVSVAALKRANPEAARGTRAGQRLVIPSR